MQISDTAAIKTGLACSKTGISVDTAKPPFAAGDIVVLKATTYGKEGQVSGSSRSRMYTVRLR